PTGVSLRTLLQSRVRLQQPELALSLIQPALHFLQLFTLPQMPLFILNLRPEFPVPTAASIGPMLDLLDTIHPVVSRNRAQVLEERTRLLSLPSRTCQDLMCYSCTLFVAHFEFGERGGLLPLNHAGDICCTAPN